MPILKWKEKSNALKNSERHKAFAWIDEETNELNIGFVDPFDTKVTSRILQRVGKHREAHVSYDMDVSRHGLWGLRFPI